MSELSSKEFAHPEEFVHFPLLNNKNHIMNRVLLHISNLVQLSGVSHMLFTSQLKYSRDLSDTGVRFLS